MKSFALALIGTIALCGAAFATDKGSSSSPGAEKSDAPKAESEAPKKPRSSGH